MGGMQPWLYGLLFIALALMLALTIDRHNYRAHRGLTRPAPVRLSRPPTPRTDRTP